MSKLRIRFTWPGRGDKKPLERTFDHPQDFEDWLDPMFAKPEIITVEEMIPAADGTPRWVAKEMA
jgi:hypothetical protein